MFKDGEPWKMLFLLRVAPVVPDSLLNYSLAVTSVPLVLYAWVSALALAPYSVLYAYLGSASSNIMDTLSGRTTQTPAERTRQILFTILSLVLGAAAIVYIIMVVKKALSKVLEQAEVDFEATHPHHHHDQVDGEVGDHESQRLLAKADRS